MKRVFAAIDISDEAREAIRSYIDDLRLGFERVPAKWERPEKLHITVKFAGSIDEEQLAAFSEQIQKAGQSVAPFQIKIVSTGAFVKRRGPSVLWLGTKVVSVGEDPFSSLAGRLHENISKRPFRPHITIARIKDPKKVNDLIERHLASDFESTPFHVDKLVIYESVLVPTGSVYSNLGSFRLRGQA
jgi:2'-5' RNA ligase